MKKWICLLLILLLLLPVQAAETDLCGEGIAWNFSGDTLTISGSGRMDDFPEGAPWQAHKGSITKVVLSGGITYIGAYAFADYDAVAAVDFGTSIVEVGEAAFKGCDGLTELYFPSSFKIFGPDSFRGCKNLTKIHSEGSPPSFRQNSLWDTYVKIYFPVDRPWNVGYIEELEAAFHGRVEFLASDGSDPYVPTEPTEENTAEETTEATEETTEATEETTVPETTEATAAPEETTAAPAETKPQPQKPAQTEPEPEQEPTKEEKPREEKLKDIIGLLIVALILVMGLVIIVAANPGGKKGKYSRKKRRK